MKQKTKNMRFIHVLPKLFILFVFTLVVAGFLLIDQMDQSRSSIVISEDQPSEIAGALLIQEEYKQQAHHYSGYITVDDPCVGITTGVSVEESTPEQITLSLQLDKDSACQYKKPARKDFIFVVPSTQEAVLSNILLDGQAVKFTLENEN